MLLLLPLLLFTLPISSTRAPLLMYYTVRDMGPAACVPHSVMTQFNPTYPAADNYPGSSVSTTDYCPLYNDMQIVGNYSGHPDFEQYTYADGCSGSPGNTLRINNLTSYGLGIPCKLVSGGSGNPSNLTNIISPIVEEGLEFGMDGLPKPIYCNHTLRNPTANPTLGIVDRTSDPRCGWGNSGSTQMGSTYVSTNNKTAFDLWYRDSPTYNMRSGGWIEVPYIGDGSWQYSSPPYEGNGEGWQSPG